MKIPWHEFMNTAEEWHAFVIGLREVLCPWPPRVQTPSPLKGEDKGEGDNPCPWPPRRHLPTANCQTANCQLSKEYHYYLFGRAMGVIAWLALAKIIQVAFW